MSGVMPAGSEITEITEHTIPSLVNHDHVAHDTYGDSI
jgi:hypothetical protein